MFAFNLNVAHCTSLTYIYISNIKGGIENVLVSFTRFEILTMVVHYGGSFTHFLRINYGGTLLWKFIIECILDECRKAEKYTS